MPQNRLNLALCVLGMVSVGCNHHNNPEIRVKSVVTQLPSGYTQASSEDGSVSIGVAPGWRSGAEKISDSLGGMSLGDSSVNSEVLKSMGKFGEEMAAKEKADEKAALAELKKKGIVINVLDGGKPTIGEARTRYCVKKSHADWFLSLAEAVEIEKPRFFENVKPVKVSLPIGDAMMMQETRTLRDGGVLTVISYLVVNSHDLYAVQFTTENQGSNFKEFAAEVVKTLRIKA